MIIKPYVGYGNIELMMNFDEVKNILSSEKTKYICEHWSNKGCTPEVPWDIIRIDNRISLFFAKDKLFKIYFENYESGILDNGVSFNMEINMAKQIDSSIEYDDWEEEYISNNGYWLETDVKTERIISISIFIKEIEEDEEFYSYKWCEK
ncbi:MAG TPA: hypothetical protein DDY98_03810 [Ruminococcaceae bacterium]|nr:hypothetical protein [Oscillospiraceae bacterium]